MLLCNRPRRFEVSSAARRFAVFLGRQARWDRVDRRSEFAVVVDLYTNQSSDVAMPSVAAPGRAVQSISYFWLPGLYVDATDRTYLTIVTLRSSSPSKALPLKIDLEVSRGDSHSSVVAFQDPWVSTKGVRDSNMYGNHWLRNHPFKSTGLSVPLIPSPRQC
jgi:hypothetical protein